MLNLLIMAWYKKTITTDSGVHKLEIIGVVNKTSNLLNGMSGDIIPNFIYSKCISIISCFSTIR